MKWEQSQGGIKRAEFAYEGNDSGHWDHVHVAYRKGGLTKSGAHYAIIGERGREFVMDADSTAAIEKTFPGLLSKLNRSTYHTTISALRNYAQYEMGAGQEVSVEPQFIPVPVPVGGSSNKGSGGINISGNNNRDFSAGYNQ